MGANTTTLARRFMSAGETRNVAVDFGGKLDVGELLTGTPAAVEVDTSDLTILSVARNTAALTVNGQAVAIDEAVTFSVAGGTAGTTYEITCTCGTDASVAQTLVATVTLLVEADA